MPQTKQTWVWMRMGDNDDYRYFDDMFSAGEELGALFDVKDYPTPPAVQTLASGTGIAVAGFYGFNYLSLFYGDNDAQITKHFTKLDLADFKRGIRAGMGLPRRVISPQKRLPRATRPRTTLGGTR